MQTIQNYGVLFACFILCLVDSRGIAGNVKLVAMNGNQYFFSSSSPYAPMLNFHLAYQYCRTLGLQLVVLETKEEVETISAYLNSADGSSLNQNKYWTSGNKLGADSWIWMSSGEQLNSSFSDYWLKNANGQPTDSQRQCMSMKAPITKRAIFTAEECNKSLPFICEQVRCLYYNYPVMQFPDPSDLRADIVEDGTAAAPTETVSRINGNYLTNEQIRAQNFISASARNIGNQNNPTTALTLSDMAAQESGRIDPSKIQRRITLRPAMSNFPYPPRYTNSFYKYKTIDYTLTSTSRPSFKKTTRETLWGPPSPLNILNPGPTVPSDTFSNGNKENFPTTLQQVDNLNNNNKKNSASVGEKSTVYVTGKILKPSNSTVSTTVESSVRSEQNVPDTYTHLEIVTSKSTKIDGQEVTEMADVTETPTTTLFHRYGTVGSGETPTSNDYVSTNPSVVFDDEQNNVGGEIGVEEEETEKPEATDSTVFFQGNGIRRPDTNSADSGVTIKAKSGEGEDGTTDSFASAGNREVSQTHSPATMMKLYQFQRNKTPINWAIDGSRSVTIIASSNAGPSKIGLGPRLKFRNRN